MPVLDSRFQPPAYLRNGHLQTILPVLAPRKLPLVYHRERLELEDGDFLDLDWSRTGMPQRPLAILLHGLEGCSTNPYILGAATALNGAGWDALGWNFRGCSETPNRLLRFYHSGETTDLARVIRHASNSYEQIVLVGFSLGGNVVLKYLGEAQPSPLVRAAVAISVPIDLASTARSLDQRWANSIYLQRFLKTLIPKIKLKARQFPGQIDLTGISRIRSFQDFDDRFSARIHGFLDAADYWRRSSARPFLPAITVPTLLLNARNDPFLATESFPFEEASQSRFLFLETPKSGGHVGFLDFAEPNRTWAEIRIIEFLLPFSR